MKKHYVILCKLPKVKKKKSLKYSLVTNKYSGGYKVKF